jgi:hypothetical protein
MTKKFVDLPPDEQQSWREWARSRHAAGSSVGEIRHELAARGVAASYHSVRCWVDDEYRIKKNLLKTGQKLEKYANDPEYRKKQHQRVTARRKVRRATDEEYRLRVNKKNAARRRLKNAQARASNE